jgi:putative colanic acid biosynthesis UDP-glucose lipid carrier transferase
MFFLNLFKKSPYSKTLVVLLLVFDIIILSLVFMTANHLVTDAININGQERQTLYVLYVLSWIVGAVFSNVYHINNLTSIKKISTTNFVALLIVSLIISVYTFLVKSGTFSISYLTSLYITSFFYLTIGRFTELKLFHFFRSLFASKKNIIIIGKTKSGQRLKKYFEQKASSQYHFLGFFDDEISSSDEVDVLGGLADVQKFCIRENVDEIFYTLPNHALLIDQLAKFADDNYIYFGLVQDVEGLSNRKIDMHVYADGKIPIVTPRRDPLRFFFNRQVKRAFDFFFSFFVILFLFPLIVPSIGLAIKLDSKGPVFFRQLRSGRNGKPFWCYKFRTMTVNSEADNKQATKNDARITKVGKFLRKTSLDELPQFYNVLIGDMSVVGPRPHMLKHTEEYSAIINDFKVRHFIHSGITGYAQVNGYRGETKDNSLMEKRVLCDNWYLENWSLSLDIKIIIQTVVNALRGEKNAY